MLEDRCLLCAITIFSPWAQMPTNTSYMHSVTAADLNHDGHMDFVTANTFDASDADGATISVYLGDGHGGFAQTDYATGDCPSGLAVADLDGDGALDLAVANGYSNTVSVLLGDGNGGFGNKTDLPLGSGPIAVAAGDFNGDGLIDLATAGPVTLFFGAGQGNFAPSQDIAGGRYPNALAVGDFDRDGLVDLAAVNREGDSVSMFLSNGSGGFSRTDFATGSYPYSVTTADFNADGKLDLATVNIVGNNISVLLGDGEGGFAPKTDFIMGSGTCIATADFNGDGKPDLVTGNTGVLLGDGNGGFAFNNVVRAAGNAIAAADFDGDGAVDLVVANDSSITVLRNVLPEDQPPTGASAGGPYNISEGLSLGLCASGSDPDGDGLSFAWDINGDGIFTDASGRVAAISWTKLQALGLSVGTVSNVRVEVSDGIHVVTSAATQVKVLWPGDANGDGNVKFADYLILEQNFGKAGKTWAEGDFTGDGVVKFADYLLLEQNFGESIAPATLLADVLVATSSSGVAEQMTLPSALGFAPDLLATDAMVGNPARTASPDVAEALPAQPLAPTGRNVSGQAGYVQLPVATPAYTGEHRDRLAPVNSAWKLKKLDRSLLEDLLAGYRLV